MHLQASMLSDLSFHMIYLGNSTKNCYEKQLNKCIKLFTIFPVEQFLPEQPIVDLVFSTHFGYTVIF